jgi:hypothetical protein
MTRLIAIVSVIVFSGSCLFLIYRLRKRAGVDIFPRLYITKRALNQLSSDMSTELDSFEKKLAICMLVSFVVGAIFMALSVQ